VPLYLAAMVEHRRPVMGKAPPHLRSDALVVTRRA
jgi:hypothetical protein